MTRLKEEDIAAVSASITRYDTQLKKQMGGSLLTVASHAYDLKAKLVKASASEHTIHVVPVTAGQGVIGGFSRTVCAILQFLGFPAEVASASDASGIAEAYEKGKDGLFIADDHRFVGINLKTGRVADNAAATGAAYAAALDLMAGGLAGKEVLVIGCGPVGMHAAEKLLQWEAEVTLFDINIQAAERLQRKLQSQVKVIDSLPRDHKYMNILEAAPAADSIPDSLLSHGVRVAAAGVPLGVSLNGCSRIAETLVHDKLELGVAAMAVCMLTPSRKGEYNG